MSKVTTELVRVTPEIAQSWLATYNTHNRGLRPNHVEAMSRDMRNGNWQMNGEAIKFALDGTLLDGQNRLSAVVASGATVEMLVVRGLNRESQESMDVGAKRSMADVLKLRGEKNHTDLAAAVRGVALWEMGMVRTKIGLTSSKATPAELLETLERHPEIREHIPIVQKLATKFGIPKGIGAALMVEFYRLNESDAFFFFERLLSGHDHEEGDPIYALREWLIDQSKRRATLTPHLRAYQFAAIICKAWNKYQDGEPVLRLTFRMGGPNPEEFPIPYSRPTDEPDA